MTSIMNISPQQLRRAADLQERIQSLQNELSHILGSSVSESAAPTRAAAGRRRISAAGRARIAAAARARWAKQRGEKAASAPAARKPRRTMSPEVKARLAAIARARWKKAKAAGRSAL